MVECGRDKRDAFRTLLVFPPVWTPVTPYLALPLLVAYLRKQGLSTRQSDASLAFFTSHLLTPDRLEGLLDRVMRRREKGDYATGSPKGLDLLKDIHKNIAAWRGKILKVQEFLQGMREEAIFYDPTACIRAQKDIYACLRLASLAYFPSSFTFNTFSNPTLLDFSSLLRFCEDPLTNPFVEFLSAWVPGILSEERPDLIGLSVSTAHQLAGALTLGRMIRKNHPEIHVTLGGRHILRLQGAFAREPESLGKFCHTLILESGERPIKALIHQLKARRSLADVPNLVYVQNGQLIFNEKGPHEPIQELPPPDFSDLPLGQYLSPTPMLPVRLSEGCYWGKCTFCSRYDNRKFQTLSPETAALHLETLQQRYGATCFTVNDDCLTPPYLEAFSRAVIARGLSCRISLWCKPVGSFTPERLRLLHGAGVRLIRWGVETGHPRILKLMNKGTRLTETRRVLRDASDVGIWNHATIIFGFPTETQEEAKETISFLQDNQEAIHSSIFFRFSLLSHSHIIRQPEAFGICAVKEPEGLFSYDHGFSCSSGMDPDALSSFLAWAQRYRLEEMYGHPFWFYLRIREYLLLYGSRYGIDVVRRWGVDPHEMMVRPLGTGVRYYFQEPQEISPATLDKIRVLVEAGGAVGRSWIEENLNRAFLLGYATEFGRIVGTMTLKRPLAKYVRRIEEKTGLNLEGYLERGYSVVRPEYRGLRIGDRLLKGLGKRAAGRKIYVTIRLDNPSAIQLTRRNRMTLAATYRNEKTGHEIGVFVNG